jgi:hypothetical protein
VSGARRYQDPAECPECGGTFATLVPWHGDGSVSRLVAHGPVGARCPGSRCIPPNQPGTAWPERNTGIWTGER